MKKKLKSGIKRVIQTSVRLMAGASVGRYVCWRIIDVVMGQTKEIEHQGLRLRLAIPNELSRARADTFSSKEPETLEWIDGLPQGSIVWDIGANVGLYSCYAAARRGCRVFAFEPSVFNLELLARNIALNGLADRVTIVPLPLSGELGINTLNMTSTDWGGAMSTFGQSYGHDGEPLEKIFEFSTIGLSMADAVDRLGVPKPDYIKMDVDGIEHLILKGGADVLRGAKGVLIEINDQFAAQADGASRDLRQAGFALKEKRQAETRLTGGAARTFNQIWTKAP